jgi:GT2 family glycosyltransferase
MNKEAGMSDKKTRVSIIIPHYNQKDCLQVLFLDIVNQTFKDFEVIIIDDCTPDKPTIDFVRDFIKDKPNMHLVQNAVNMRFVKTVNKGITLAKGEYICLLNSDTKIESTFVQRNIEILDSDPTIGGITCIVVDKSGQNWFSGGSYNKGFPINLTDEFEGLRQVDFIAGTAVFYRKEIFDRIGPFDENYIMYHEDVEFGLRVKQFTGYRLCTFSDKLVTHLILPSLTGANIVYYDARNLILLSRRFAPQYLLSILGQIIWQASARVFGAFLNILTLKPLSAPSLKIRWAYAGIRGAFSGIKAKQTHYVHTDNSKL